MNQFDKEKILEEIDKSLTFLFVMLKVSTRDMYLFPLRYINKMLLTNLILAVTTIAGRIFHIYCYLDYRGVLIALLLLCCIKLSIKDN